MKILFITPLPPPIHGSSIMSMYIKNSKSINNNAICHYINLSTSRNIDEIQKFSLIKIFRFLGSYFKVFFHLLTNRYDVCYLAISCFGIPFIKDAPFVLMCKLLCKNVIIHFHNKGITKYIQNPFYKWMYNLVYTNTTIILLSELLYDDVKNVIKREQVKICPNGIPEIKEIEYKRHNSIPNILFLSNLIESKGVICLLDACKNLKNKKYNFKCNIIGSESKEINKERITQEIEKRGLSNNVFYKGRVYGNDKELYYSEANIFIFPTYYPQECFPLVLLEAMQHKLPCISSYEGAIPEIIKDRHNGFLCNPQDINLLTKKIEELIRNKALREEMGNNGFSLYKEKYTLANFEENIKSILGIKSSNKA